MTRRIAGAALAMSIAAAVFGAPRKTSQPSPPAALPALGTALSEFPPGDGKAIADKACLQCHSADMPRQQRITEKQWTAEVEKMTRWGAEVSADDKAALIGYLSAHFGPTNDAFTPVEVAPLSAPRPAH